MTIRKFSILLCLLFITSQYTYSTKWSEALKRGSIDKTNFKSTLEVEVYLGLIIVPVVINGKTYRFLLDTGAPFSISEKLQDKFDFKQVSKGKIVDSEKNRTKVKYVQVDTTYISDIPFVNQTAIVGDFQANPIIKCLNLDGILGSNLMRHCNWRIDYQDEIINLSDHQFTDSLTTSVSLTFHTDKQYNLLVNTKIHNKEFITLKIDYGSNGSLTIPKGEFESLLKNKELNNVYFNTGYSQSGFVGEEIKNKSKIALLDSLSIEALVINNIKVTSGKSNLIGKAILSRYIITINWEKEELNFQPHDSIDYSYKSFGLQLGFSMKDKYYIQSVIENSEAYNKGIRPNMQIIKIDSMDFSNSHNYCDYIDFMDQANENMYIEFLSSDGSIQKINLQKEELFTK